MYAGSQGKLYRDPGLRSIGSFGSNGSSDTHMVSNVSAPLPNTGMSPCEFAEPRRRRFTTAKRSLAAQMAMAETGRLGLMLPIRAAPPPEIGDEPRI